MTATQPLRTPPVDVAPDRVGTLAEIERRLLWLSTFIVHHANHLRPNPDGVKVGGHQASSASVVTILTALYFHFLRAGDRVSIKPHASPVYHAAQYLLGRLSRDYLTTLRDYGGLQAYPSITKDPDPPDFSTGSVGLGAVAPVYAALAHRYVGLHFGDATPRRFVSLVGDAELDEGNVWETVAEEAIRGLGNVIWIVDLNRQSLDRVVPGVRAARMKALFAGAGWRVLEAKYGRRLTAAMAGPGGDELRARLDAMSNEEYQALIRIREPAELRRRLGVTRATADTPDEELPGLLTNLGGHDLPCLMQVLDAAAAVQDAPVVVFAYTIKGYGLPFAGHPLNHSQLLNAAQIEELRTAVGVPADDPWAAFAPDSPAGRLCAEAARRLFVPEPAPQGLAPEAVPAAVDPDHPAQSSTQEAFGRTLTRLVEHPIRERLVTFSPDVATSTHLAGWINRVGVFALERAEDYEGRGPRLVKWQPRPQGQHVELGISEMNLFMALGQFGRARELVGQQLVPIGTVYDPFVCRGLDALVYSLYVGARMIFAGTPAGVSLSREGGAHQSTVTPSLGIELPNLVFVEPCFAREVEWLLLDAIRRCCDARDGSTYLRLSTKPVDQTALDEPLRRLGEDELRRQVLAGGYRIVDRRVACPELPEEATVQIAAGGIMVPEAIAAARILHREGVAANVVNVTSADRLYEDLRLARRRQLDDAHAPGDLGHLETLFPPEERHAPIVTVEDGASHALAFLGGAYGALVVPLGADAFGQSGSRDALYRAMHIDVDRIVAAALLALELRG